MKISLSAAASCLLLICSNPVRAQTAEAPPRALRDLNGYFPMQTVPSAEAWAARREELKRRVQVATGLWPMPEKTPLNAAVHGRVERDDFTVDRVCFESAPGFFVTGSLYRPKKSAGLMPGIFCPHGHWPEGRFQEASLNEVKQQIAAGAEKFEDSGRAPLQARCAHLARMGCVVLMTDMIGYADSIQFPSHRHGPGAEGMLSAAADLRLISYLGLQTWSGIRALDFLSGLEGVDPKRLGVTGESGGGTQTMMVTALDERVAAAFPAVMVSTSMQGGCTCENAPYLRVGAGNIDIAALTAPRPLGMTAADDWTRELATRGFPDLQALYRQLGQPDLVEAHFFTRFPHNYNHVSRTAMYHFFNRHFRLGWAEPIVERDFPRLTRDELSVWTADRPRPGGAQAGEAYEAALVRQLGEASDRQMHAVLHPADSDALGRSRQILGPALEVMIGRGLPAKAEVSFELGEKKEGSGWFWLTGKTRNASAGESVNATFLYPKKWNKAVVLWLSLQGPDALAGESGQPLPHIQRLLDKGFAIACPDLYLRSAPENPRVPFADAQTYTAYSAYTYGYNPTLLARRAHDTLAMLAMIRHDENYRPERVYLAAEQGTAPVAAAAGALARDQWQGIALDTGGFRFAKTSNVWDPNFQPGAVKYGDLPGWLALMAPVPMAVVGEERLEAAEAFYQAAQAKDALQLLPAGGKPGAEQIADWLASQP